jgi:hypothetical protein
MLDSCTVQYTNVKNTIPSILWRWNACTLVVFSNNKGACFINLPTFYFTPRVRSHKCEVVDAVAFSITISSITGSVVIVTTVRNA